MVMDEYDDIPAHPRTRHGRVTCPCCGAPTRIAGYTELDSPKPTSLDYRHEPIAEAGTREDEHAAELAQLARDEQAITAEIAAIHSPLVQGRLDSFCRFCLATVDGGLIPHHDGCWFIRALMVAERRRQLS